MTDLDKRLIEAARMGDIAQCKLLLAIGADPNTYGSIALSWAAHNGHTDCVKLLEEAMKHD